MKTLDECKKIIFDALKAASKMNKALNPQILAAASALRTVLLANDEIDGLTCVTLPTTQGQSAHPVFRVKKDAEDSLTKTLKALGLIAADLNTDTEEDPLVELTRELLEDDTPNSGKKRKA